MWQQANPWRKSAAPSLFFQSTPLFLFGYPERFLVENIFELEYELFERRCSCHCCSFLGKKKKINQPITCQSGNQKKMEEKLFWPCLCILSVIRQKS